MIDQAGFPKQLAQGKAIERIDIALATKLDFQVQAC